MILTSSPRKTSLFFALYVAVVLPLCFLGYGSDNDTYGVLEAGRSTWHDGHWMTSRNPGYWLYEALVYGVSHLGGSVATDMASMCAGAFILWRFIVLCRKVGIHHEYLLASCVLFVPTFLIAASSTMDYLWSIAFLIATVEFLLGSRLTLASLAGAIAIGFRASNALVLAGIYVGLLIYSFMVGSETKKVFRIAIAGAVSAILGMVFFIPSWLVAHHTMSFLTPGTGSAAMWTLKMHVGRFIYKSAYLFGPIASFILLFMLIRHRILLKFSSLDDRVRKGFSMFLGAFLADLILFGKFPIEVSYLLPGLVFFLLLAGASFLKVSRAGIIAVLCGIISFNFLSIFFAKPNVPMHATNAKLSIGLRQGVLLEDIGIRLKAKPCQSVSCWQKKVNELPAI